MRTVMPAGSCGGGVGRPSTMSGCRWTSRAASTAAAAISGAVCSIHSKDSGMISSRWRARTVRMSAAVTGGLLPSFGRA